MARKRTIDPDIWTDDKFASLTDLRACLLYVGCISQADDAGRLEWSARQLWARLFASRDDVKMADVETWMSKIADANLVKTYTVGRKVFAVFEKWHRYQHTSRPSPSKIPEPPAGLLDETAHGTPTERPRNAQRAPTERPAGAHGAPTERPAGAQVPSVSVSVSVSDTVSDTELSAFRARWAERTGTIRDEAMRTRLIPDEPLLLTAQSKLFLDAFGNCRAETSIRRNSPIVAGVLAAMRSRGATTRDAWKAFEDAIAVKNYAPLLGYEAKSALNHLRGRPGKGGGNVTTAALPDFVEDDRK